MIGRRAGLLAAALLAPLGAQSPAALPVPATGAETSGWTRTSTHDEVVAFATAVAESSGGRLRLDEYGTSGERRRLIALERARPAGEPAAGRLRVLVQANVHGGEVEGKEVVLALAREIAAGAHDALLAGIDLLLIPDLNPDGNDRIDRRNRVEQNGPEQGVGRRENAAGLDLNRDYVKLESPEIRALVARIRAFDPHLLIDLHTTNGSYHGYHLTYAPSLAVNADPALDRHARERLLPALARDLRERDGVRSEHYGNFGRRGEPQHWVTFDARPRFGTNYAGLRNRFGLLCEAYSYLDFARRGEVTRAFVLAALRAAAADRVRLVELCAAADACCCADPLELGYSTQLRDPVEREILVGSARREALPDGLGTRLIAEAAFEAKRMAVQDGFRATKTLPLPAAWAIVGPAGAAHELLLAHGIELRRLSRATKIEAERFVPSGLSRSRAAFQGHRTITLQGEHRAESLELPAGTLIVPRRQPLARLAAQLLEPLSEDGLVTWNHFEAELAAAKEAAAGGAGGSRFPVLRVLAPAELPCEPDGAGGR